MREVVARDAELLARAREMALSLEVLTVARLRALAEEAGHDVAAAVFYEAVRAAHGGFMGRVEGRSEGAGEAVEELRRRAPLVAIVRGALFREFPQTGADGRQFVESLGGRGLGLAMEFVPIRSLGRLEENGEVVARWLAGRAEQEIIVVSFSKGGADVRAALGRADAGEAFRRVAAWINVGGILRGSPLVNWLGERPLRRMGVRLVLWLKGAGGMGAIEELRYGEKKLQGPVVTPAGMRVVHVVAVPRECDVGRGLARRAYMRVRPWGPNDGGGLLLGDVAGLGCAGGDGVIYPVWGSDHYMKRADIGRLFTHILAEAILHPGAGKEV